MIKNNENTLLYLLPRPLSNKYENDNKHADFTGWQFFRGPRDY